MYDSTTSFPTSNQSPSRAVVAKTNELLNQIRIEMNIERAVILAKHEGKWTLSSSHAVDRENFWTTTPISLSVMENAIEHKQDVLIMDVDRSDQFRDRDSILLGGMRSIACTTNRDSQEPANLLIYVDSVATKNAYGPNHLERLKTLAGKFNMP